MRPKLRRAIATGASLSPRPALSVVIPAYNEAGRLGPTLEALSRHRFGGPHEILVVDDGSTDGTPEVAARFPRVRVLGHHPNRGKGAAVRTGVLAARGQWILVTDADLSTPLSEVTSLQEAARTSGSPIAIASRGLWRSRIDRPQPLYRVVMGKTYNLLVQALLLPGVWDTQCGFKLFHRDAAQAIFSRARLDGFSFDAESLYLARRLGYPLIEVPVCWRNDPETKVRAWHDSLRMFRDLWQIRRLHRGVPPLPRPHGDLRRRH